MQVWCEPIGACEACFPHMGLARLLHRWLRFLKLRGLHPKRRGQSRSLEPHGLVSVRPAGYLQVGRRPGCRWRISAAGDNFIRNPAARRRRRTRVGSGFQTLGEVRGSIARSLRRRSSGDDAARSASAHGWRKQRPLHRLVLVPIKPQRKRRTEPGLHHPNIDLGDPNVEAIISAAIAEDPTGVELGEEEDA